MNRLQSFYAIHTNITTAEITATPDSDDNMSAGPAVDNISEGSAVDNASAVDNE